MHNINTDEEGEFSQDVEILLEPNQRPMAASLVPSDESMVAGKRAEDRARDQEHLQLVREQHPTPDPQPHETTSATTINTHNTTPTSRKRKRSRTP